VGKRYWEWAPIFRLDRRRVGLIIIDMQNGFVEDGAPLDVPMARQQVPTLKRLLGFFREQGLPVFFTQFCVSDQFNYPFYWRMAEQRGLRLDPPDRMELDFFAEAFGRVARVEKIISELSAEG
jgi:ureidoacrylate peracid hydrolase